ncbi:hypothetical protein SMSP2_01956 [Limihaloglobus sulfuriphilus]|uniref:Uncharacterized protein n=1 Tax=Limihaloglobus sulfuriphilus TaxID=1851148 RepID=A0A1Q2MFX6_9BACT|nr:hypothetical protein [Limihaloglobus sulfuriphilus]AQQ71580.1 hypothetical protein SMSP2_01956 [Limihaloglobus sulfuriphilus]
MEDKLHYSFSDRGILEKVFNDGFSAQESTLPEGGFDPESDWENSYDVIYTGPQDFTNESYIYYGSLRINTVFDKGGVIVKAAGIRQLEQNFNRERQHLHVRAECNRDRLFSLKDGSEWTLEAELKNQLDPAAAGFKKIKETGRLGRGRIQKKNAKGKWQTYAQTDPAIPVVSDWSLLAAVQLMPRSGEYSFNYFPQLERFHTGHSIRFLEIFQARFGGREVTLHGYAQSGEGITPFYYWVDDHGRLLIARFALSAFVYNSNPCVERQAQNDK